MAEHVTIRLNKLDIRRLSARHALRAVDRASRQAQVEARIDARGPYSTGDLARSIYQTSYMKGQEAVGEVGSNHPKARLIHDGAKPHPIHPIAPNGTLVFYWRKVGRTVYFKRPHIRMHPGMEGKRFLTGPLERVGRRHRFLVVTRGH